MERNSFLPLAAGAHVAGAHNSGDQTNPDARGLQLVIDVSVVNADNEIQHVAVDATGGTFTLTFGGQTTAAIAFNALAATVQTRLEALSSIGAGNVSVTGGPGAAGGATPYIVEFIGTLAAANQAQMTSSGASLTGGAGTATVSTTQGGGGNPSSLVVKVQGKDPVSGKYYDLLTSAALTAVATTVLTLYPGVTVSANVAVSNVLPVFWRIVHTLTGDAANYSVVANLVL